MVCTGNTLPLGPRSLDIDELERGFLVDRVRAMMKPGHRVSFCLYSQHGPWAAPVAMTITNGAWLVQAYARGCDLFFRRLRHDEKGDPQPQVFPDDLLIGPEQTDPERNGRRGYPVNFPVMGEPTSPNVYAGNFITVECWLPADADEREVAVTLYGVTMDAEQMNPRRGEGCFRRPG